MRNIKTSCGFRALAVIACCLCIVQTLPAKQTPPASSTRPATIDPNTGLPVPTVLPEEVAKRRIKEVGGIYYEGPRVDPNTGLLVPVVLPEEVAKRRMKEVAFDGVPFAEVIKGLHKQYPEMNFLIPTSVGERADGFPVKFQLRNVGLLDILNAILYASDGLIGWYSIPENMIVFQINQTETGQAPGKYSAPPPDRSVNVIPLTAILRTQDDAVVRKTVEVATQITRDTLARLYDDFDEGRHMTRGSYHPGSGVLVLVGPEYANKVFMDVLKSMDHKGRQTLGSEPGSTPSQPKPEAGKPANNAPGK